MRINSGRASLLNESAFSHTLERLFSRHTSIICLPPTPLMSRIIRIVMFKTVAGFCAARGASYMYKTANKRQLADSSPR